MLAELRSKSQITIPKELVDKLGLAEGDKLEIYEENGIICIMPIVVYPQDYLEQIQKEVEETKALGEQPIFDSADKLIAWLKED